MSNDDKSPQIIQEALRLDGAPDTLKQFYAKWAAEYDADDGDAHYWVYQVG